MMNNNIDKRLTELFEKNNIIFWYDDEGKFKEEFDSLQIDVNKLLIDNNQFNIKYQILSSSFFQYLLIFSLISKTFIHFDIKYFFLRLNNSLSLSVIEI